MLNFRTFLGDESGSGTYMAVGGLMFGAIVLGLSLDSANGFRERTRLQIATDAAALAAAANIDEPSIARAVALETANRNLDIHNAITESDISLGYIHESTFEFVDGTNADGVYTAAHVDARRGIGRSNEITTMLINYVGVDFLETNAQAVAATRRGGGGGVLAACEDASIISEDEVNTGGGITLTGGICIHGANAVKTGGNDWYGPEVRFSAEDIDTIRLEKYSPGHIPPEQMKFERILEPVILPQLETMHAQVWADVSQSCDWNNDELEIDGSYSGTLLPTFVMNNGLADVVCWGQNVQIQPGDLKPYTVYVAKGSVIFNGNVQQDNIAIISQKRISAAGGNDLSFDQVYFFGDRVGLAGNLTWGPRGPACEVEEYQVYLFGKTSVQMGGSNHDQSYRNVVAVAPTVNPGGNMSASGLYIESARSIQLGGGVDIHGCGHNYTSEIEITDTAIPQPDEVTGSFLVQ